MTKRFGVKGAEGLPGLLKLMLDRPLNVDRQSLHEDDRRDPLFAPRPYTLESGQPVRLRNRCLNAGANLVALFENKLPLTLSVVF